MFVWEILNIIKFVLFMIGMAGIFVILYKRVPDLFKGKWNAVLAYLMSMTAAALLTYPQFFTLTEEASTMRTINVMERQSISIRNDSQLDDYLKKKEKKVVDKREQFDVELATEKAKTLKSIEQSFSKGEK